MPARFFVDENDLALGKVLDAEHGDVVYLGHPDLPEVPRGALDDEWLPVVAERGMVVITRVKKIRYRPAEKRAWIAHGVRGFFLTGKKSFGPCPAVLPGVVAKTMDFFHTFGMPGRWYSELFDIAADQYGYVTTEDLQQLGGDAKVLVDMRRHGHVDRVAHGLYRFRSFPAGPLDEFMQATLWPRRLGVISHDSALDLWDLCDVNPAKIHVTVPKAARLRRATPPEYVVHTRDLDPVDVTRFEGIPVVTALRAILDGTERHLDRRLIDQAVDSARRRGLITREELAMVEAVG